MVEKEQAVEVRGEGGPKLKVGIQIADGPETYRLMLTRPLDKEGFIVEIPLETIEDIYEIEPGPRGAPPEIVHEDRD